MAVVGRAAEVARVTAALEGHRPVLLEGEPGAGKTTLWRAALDLADGFAHRLTASPAETETDLPFAALGDLLAHIEAGASLEAPLRSALDLALDRVAAETAADRLTVARAALAVLARATSDGPVLVAVDDLQWLDRDSAGALSFALRRLDRSDLAVLVASRPLDRPNGDRGLRRALRDLDAERVEVGPVSVDELALIVRGRLGLTLARPAARRLHELAGGNPLFGLELARATGGELSPGARITLPRDLAGVLRARLAQLSPDAADAVLVAAAARVPAWSLVERLAAGAGLSEAIAAGALEPAGERVRFAHPLLRSVAYDAASDSDRRDVHARISGDATDDEDRAYHLALATRDPDEAVAEALEETARSVERRGRPEVAAHLFEHAARLTPAGERPASRRRRSAASDAHFRAGSFAHAYDLRRLLVDDADSGAERTHALVELLVLEPQVEQALAIADEALAGIDDPALASDVHHQLAVLHVRSVGVETACVHAETSVRLAERIDDVRRQARGLGYLEYLCRLAGHEPDPVRVEQALGLERAAGDFAPFSPTLMLGLGNIAARDPVAAEPCVREQLRRTIEAGDELRRSIALAALAEVDLLAGRWADARRNGADAVLILEQTSTPMDGAPHRVASASVAAHVGFFDDATAEAEELLRISQATGVVATQARALGVLGHVALQNGDYDTAIDRLEQAVGLVLALGGGLPMLLPAALDLAEAAFRAGEVERMGRVALVVLDAPAPRSPWAEAMRARARAFSLEAEGERERAAEAAATSLALAREHPVPFERARAALLVGLFLRRGRRWREARDALGEALEIFDELGAAGWAELAASELARIPGRSRGGAELTETERRVAELVAQGLSNKEVAGRLFVTVRTVEANLTKVYAKLGIRSRTELAGRLHP